MPIDFAATHDRVIYVRRLTKLSQRKFCEEAGFVDMIGVATLRLVESQKRELSEFVAAKICKRATELGVTVDVAWLLQNEGRPPRFQSHLVEAHSPQSRGERLAYLQSLAKLPDKAMSRTVSENTIQGWRHGNYGGVTVNAAVDIVEQLAQAGVYVSAQWLLFNEGLGPQIGHASHFKAKRALQQQFTATCNDEANRVQSVQGHPVFSRCVVRSTLVSAVPDHAWLLINEQIYLFEKKTLSCRLSVSGHTSQAPICLQSEAIVDLIFSLL